MCLYYLGQTGYCLNSLAVLAHWTFTQAFANQGYFGNWYEPTLQHCLRIGDSILLLPY